MKKFILSLGGLLVLVLFLMYATSFYTINTGEVAVVSRFGKVVRVDTEGMKNKIPFIEKIYKIEVRNMTQKSKFEVSTKDLQSVITEVAVQYKILDPLKVYRTFGVDYKARLVEPRISEIVQSVSSDYTIEELISERQQLSQDMYKGLKEDLNKFGIEIINVSIVNHDFSDNFEDAVEQKKASEQLAQKQEIENNQRIKTAEANLKVKELEAKSNAILTESLSDKVLRKQMIDKWDGTLPRVVGNDKMIFNLEQ